MYALSRAYFFCFDAPAASVSVATKSAANRHLVALLFTDTKSLCFKTILIFSYVLIVNEFL